MNIESSLAIFGLPGGMEWVFILIAALLIFGRRLPDVARSIGRSIVEFKKGVRDIRDEVDHESQAPPPSRLDRQISEGLLRHCGERLPPILSDCRGSKSPVCLKSV